MRYVALLFPMFLVVSLLASGCGSGCAHGSHTHATGSQFEQPPDYEGNCTCTEAGQIECTSGGSAMN